MLCSTSISVNSVVLSLNVRKKIENFLSSKLEILSLKKTWTVTISKLFVLSSSWRKMYIYLYNVWLRIGIWSVALHSLSLTHQSMTFSLGSYDTISNSKNRHSSFCKKKKWILFFTQIDVLIWAHQKRNFITVAKLSFYIVKLVHILA